MVSKGPVLVHAWTRLQGVGPRKFSQPLELVCGIFSGACLNMPDLSSQPFCYRTRDIGSLWPLPAEWGRQGVGCGQDDREHLPLILSQSVCWKPLVLLLQHHQLDHVEPLFDKGQELIQETGPKS